MGSRNRLQSVMRVFAAALAVATALATGCGKPDIRKGMARLDGAYIPALSYTNEGDTARSKAAFVVLKVEWREFRNRHANSGGKDREWPSDLSQAEVMIQRAAWLADGGSLTEAHEALEPVRVVMMKLRQRNGIPYFLDYLTEFHHPMEALVLAAKGRDAKSLTLGAIDSLRASYALAIAAWQRVESAGVDPELYDFSEKELAEANAHIKAEAQALDRLGSELAGSDKAAMLTAAVAVKPEFAVLYKMFGDHEKLQ